MIHVVGKLANDSSLIFLVLIPLDAMIKALSQLLKVLRKGCASIMSKMEADIKNEVIIGEIVSGVFCLEVAV